MKYEIETLEMFLTKARYLVEATSGDEAMRLVRSGNWAYDWHDHIGDVDDDEFLKFLSVEPVNDAP